MTLNLKDPDRKSQAYKNARIKARLALVGSYGYSLHDAVAAFLDILAVAEIKPGDTLACERFIELARAAAESARDGTTTAAATEGEAVWT